jgi:hypothetical protein
MMPVTTGADIDVPCKAAKLYFNWKDF